MIKNAPSDIQIEVEKLTGLMRGIVEDNNDPLKAGRVRIRVHGVHTPRKIKNDLEGIPTDELPWAEPCLPITEGGVSGFGSFGVPLQGSQVLLFFEHGNPLNPIYFASMPAIPEDQSYYSNNKRSNSKFDGFKDPDGNYPSKNRLGEPDYHRLARGVKNETLVITKNNQRDIGIPTALGGSWSEPESPYNAQYPHNYIINTHGGIAIELDSTPNSTRINIYHPSNSFIEIDNDGNMVVKNNAEKYEIVTEGKNIHIKQQRNLTIDSDSKKLVGGNEDIEISGDKTEQIDGNLDKTISGNKSEEVEGNETETIGGNKEETITGNKEETIDGNLNITVTGNANITSPSISLNGNTTINGLLSALGSSGVGGTMSGSFTISNGNITINYGDVSADSISLKNHYHKDSLGGNTSPALS